MSFNQRKTVLHTCYQIFTIVGAETGEYLEHYTYDGPLLSQTEAHRVAKKNNLGPNLSRTNLTTLDGHRSFEPGKHYGYITKQVDGVRIPGRKKMYWRVDSRDHFQVP